MAVGSIEITRLGLLKSIGPKRQSINSELPTLLDIESDSEGKLYISTAFYHKYSKVFNIFF